MDKRHIMRTIFALIWKCFLIICPALLVCAIWEKAARRSSNFAFLFGSPSLVMKYLGNYVFHGEGVSDIFVTGAEAFGGFVAGNLLGVIFGLALAYFPKIERTVRSYMIMLGAIPIFALAPIMIMWFGVGYLAKFMMALLSVVLVTTAIAYTGAINTNPGLFRLLMSFEASRWQIFKKVVIPSALNSVITSFRLTVGFALVGAFIGEFISAERGLGYRILKASGLYNIPGVIGGVLLIAFLALTLRGILYVFVRLLVPWHWESQEPLAT